MFSSVQTLHVPPPDSSKFPKIQKIQKIHVFPATVLFPKYKTLPEAMVHRRISDDMKERLSTCLWKRDGRSTPRAQLCGFLEKGGQHADTMILFISIVPWQLGGHTLNVVKVQGRGLWHSRDFPETIRRLSGRRIKFGFFSS